MFYISWALGVEYLFTFVAMSAMFQASSGRETLIDLGQAGCILVERCILQDKSVSRMMMILVIQKTIKAQREIITR
jgi:hypothetical protein